MKKKLRYLISWVIVRPRRWLFRQMISNSYLRIKPEWCDFYERWQLPNVHWWILYKTIFKFFKWLYWDAWRPLCKWDRSLIHKPWYAAYIQRIGETTAAFAISGFECFHCASKDGCQVELSNDETGEMFILQETWTSATQDGTDYRFRGITICPKCGYRSEFEDGSI